MKGFLLGVVPIIVAGVLEARAAGARQNRPEPIEVLEHAFRQGSAEGLRRLIGRDEKIYMTSPSLGFEDGYYSADQVCLQFQEAFHYRVTVRFDFLKGEDSPPEVSRLIAVARWSYRKGKSREQTSKIAFTLTRRDGGWFLKEVRDIP